MAAPPVTARKLHALPCIMDTPVAVTAAYAEKPPRLFVVAASPQWSLARPRGVAGTAAPLTKATTELAARTSGPRVIAPCIADTAAAGTVAAGAEAIASLGIRFITPRVLCKASGCCRHRRSPRRSHSRNCTP